VIATITPFKATYSGRAALAEVLIDIRSQAGASNWEEFCSIALAEAQLELPYGTLEIYAPNPRYGSVPNSGLFFAIDAWNQVRSDARKFKFSNGTVVTGQALQEVLYGLRHQSGALVSAQ
jgi:hypothetical protein